MDGKSEVDMGVEQIVSGVYQVSLGFVNAFLLVGDGTAIIDTGISGSAPKILNGLREIGRRPNDVRHILLTHLHADHTGSAAALKDAVAADGGEAKIYMHPLDAESFQKGISMRPAIPAPGLLNWLVVNVFTKLGGPNLLTAAPVDCLLADGDELPISGGLQVIHAPGHTAGQVVFFLQRNGGVLFTADACGHMFGSLGYPILFEDFSIGQHTLRKLGSLKFETAAFSHGAPIRSGAGIRFRERWGTDF